MEKSGKVVKVSTLTIIVLYVPKLFTCNYQIALIIFDSSYVGKVSVLTLKVKYYII